LADVGLVPDVSTAQTTADARDALLHAEGHADERAVWTALMGDWLEILDAQPERDSEIAKVLYDLATSDDVPAREALGPMSSFLGCHRSRQTDDGGSRVKSEERQWTWIESSSTQNASFASASSVRLGTIIFKHA
jgi:hypothetical protein